MKWTLVFIAILATIMLAGCGGDNCMTGPESAPILEGSSIADDDAPGETISLKGFIAPIMYVWEGDFYYIYFDRACGDSEDGWRMIPQRLQPCEGVTFYAQTDSDGKTSICSDVPPCDSLTQRQINAMYVWAIGTPDEASSG
jgi:hypothetical protein